MYKTPKINLKSVRGEKREREKHIDSWKMNGKKIEDEKKWK